MKTLTAFLLVALCAAAAPAQGSNVSTDTVAGLQANIHPLTAPGGKMVQIVVRGQNASNLDLLIFDENGNLVAADTDASSVCIATWTPRWTGRFYATVVNRGLRSNTYTISAQ